MPMLPHYLVPPVHLVGYRSISTCCHQPTMFVWLQETTGWPTFFTNTRQNDNKRKFSIIFEIKASTFTCASPISMDCVCCCATYVMWCVCVPASAEHTSGVYNASEYDVGLSYPLSNERKKANRIPYI